MMLILKLVIAAAVGFVAGYLVKRNNPTIAGVDAIIDKLDDTVEDELKEKIKEAADKAKEALKK